MQHQIDALSSFAVRLKSMHDDTCKMIKQLEDHSIVQNEVITKIHTMKNVIKLASQEVRGSFSAENDEFQVEAQTLDGSPIQVTLSKGYNVRQIDNNWICEEITTFRANNMCLTTTCLNEWQLHHSKTFMYRIMRIDAKLLIGWTSLSTDVVSIILDYTPLHREVKHSPSPIIATTSHPGYYKLCMDSTFNGQTLKDVICSDICRYLKNRVSVQEVHSKTGIIHNNHDLQFKLGTNDYGFFYTDDKKYMSEHSFSSTCSGLVYSSNPDDSVTPIILRICGALRFKSISCDEYYLIPIADNTTISEHTNKIVKNVIVKWQQIYTNYVDIMIGGNQQLITLGRKLCRVTNTGGGTTWY